MRRGGGPEIVRSVERPFQNRERERAPGGRRGQRQRPARVQATRQAGGVVDVGAAVAERGRLRCVRRSPALARARGSVAGLQRQSPPGPKRTGWKPVRRGSWDGLK